MHRFVSMKTSIEYLHVRLKSRLRITKNEVKTSPALVTAQLSISAHFFLHSEIHFGRQNPSKSNLERVTYKSITRASNNNELGA